MAKTHLLVLSANKPPLAWTPLCRAELAPLLCADVGSKSREQAPLYKAFARGDDWTFPRFRYFDDTYFSRRICGTGKPCPFSNSKQASTMFGLPHR